MCYHTGSARIKVGLAALRPVLWGENQRKMVGIVYIENQPDTPAKWVSGKFLTRIYAMEIFHRLLVIYYSVDNIQYPPRWSKNRSNVRLFSLVKSFDT